MDHLLFKVWDVEGNDGKGCWIEDSTGFDWWCIGDDGKVMLLSSMAGSPVGVIHPEPDEIVPYAPGRFDILLWSGEKDKNDDDIYDGHIFGGNVHLRGVVERQPNGSYDVVFTRKDLGHWPVTDPRISRSIIKGHRYTHPHLLKGEK